MAYGPSQPSVRWLVRGGDDGMAYGPSVCLPRLWIVLDWIGNCDNEKVVCGRLFEEAPVKLSLRSLVGFLTELCEFSHQQLSHHSRQLSIIGHTQTQTAPHTTLLLYRLGDIMSRSIATDRPHLHLMRVWSVAAPHFVEVFLVSCTLHVDSPPLPPALTPQIRYDTIR